MTLQPVLLPDQIMVTSARTKVIESLARFRQEWQSLANDQSLVDIQASVGLMLADIADQLEMTDQEKYVVLGHRLINQVDAFMEQRIEEATLQ